MVKAKKLCTKCERILSYSDFHKNKNVNNGLHSWCTKCRSKDRKERRILLKQEIIEAFGSRCVYIDKNGNQCLKNIKDNLEELELSHPNNDGGEHRKSISSGRGGYSFYKSLKKRNWNTDGFVIEVRCKSHHSSFDRKGKKNPSYGKYGKLNPLYKNGKFNDPDWLKKKYVIMSLREIADECGVGCTLILNRMKEFNISRRRSWMRV